MAVTREVADTHIGVVMTRKRGAGEFTTSKRIREFICKGGFTNGNKPSHQNQIEILRSQIVGSIGEEDR